jgi:hypothetical protein
MPRAASAVLVLVLLACQRPPSAVAAGPDEAYRAFAAAVRAGQGKVAYAALSKRSRDGIEARSQEVAAGSGGLIKDDPTALTFSTGLKPKPIDAVKVLNATDALATLEVSAGGQVTTVTMVKEEGRWLVELGAQWSREPSDHG